jgi:hypothetical protein
MSADSVGLELNLRGDESLWERIGSEYARVLPDP